MGLYKIDTVYKDGNTYLNSFTMEASSEKNAILGILDKKFKELFKKRFLATFIHCKMI
jgi:hypothetical protein